MDEARSALMQIAWRDFILWAASEPEAVAAFNAETGRTFMSMPTNMMDTLIDQATGKIDDDARAFVDWVTVSHWGLEYAPTAYRAARGLGVMPTAPSPKD